jgi:hypothetical protein
MARILSSTPGRLRVRLETRRERLLAADFHPSTAEIPHLRGAEVNRAASSLTLTYDGARVDEGLLLSILAERGLVMTAPDATLRDTGQYAGMSPASETVLANLAAANRAAVRFSGGTADLKLLIPLLLALIGTMRGLFRGFQFTQIPGYLFLWYAFDTFYKLHGLSDRMRLSGAPRLEQTASSRSGRRG